MKQQSSYYLDYQDSIHREDYRMLIEGINQEAFQAKKMTPIRPFSLLLKNHIGEVGEILGGVAGVMYYGCLFVDALWVHKNLRHQGWGKKLMLEAEQMAKKHLCTFATVNTMDWQALPFYQKLGYEIEFIRTGYVKQSKMYLLRKQL